MEASSVMSTTLWEFLPAYRHCRGVTTVSRTPDSRREETTDPHAEGPSWNTTSPAAGIDHGCCRCDYAVHLRRTSEEGCGDRFTDRHVRYEYLGDTELPRVITYPDGTQLLLDYDGQMNLTASETRRVRPRS